MTEDQKQQIYNLRVQGLGYKAIAKEVVLSVNAIKGYCKRYGLTGLVETSQANGQEIKDKSILCLRCKNPILRNKRGRTKKFCSDACRYSWWNENQDKRSKKEAAIYHFTCQHCGQSFMSYGDKLRKYCSHDCYIKARFWQEELQSSVNTEP